jgi:predicted RNA binding protein YcfA (HicA-like mRNA interferase family)
LSNKLIPVSRRELIKRLKRMGFVGPYAGPDHAFMVRGTNRVKIPNPHGQEINVNLLSEILREAGISREEWLSTA